MGILDLFELKGFDRKCRFKWVRHAERSKGYDMEDFLRRGLLNYYQAYQSKPVFDNLDYIVSFIGLDNRRARFLGVFRLDGRRPGLEGPPLPPGCPEDWRTWGLYYELSEVPGFEEFKHRVVVDWGKGARGWHQWGRGTDKTVVELLPEGQLQKTFDDYLGFTLTHDELLRLYVEPDANREWRARLSAVAGIYLILATTTGAQYVGSAHGLQGFWGRWRDYAGNGHGGNELLRELISSQPDEYPGKFVYSILQILPRTTTHADLLKWEGLYKEKLGTRAERLGLNAN